MPAPLNPSLRNGQGVPPQFAPSVKVNSLTIHVRPALRAVFRPLVLAAFVLSATTAEAQQFVDVTATAGVAFDYQTHQTILSLEELQQTEPHEVDDVPRMNHWAETTSLWFAGGVAAGDYDGDQLPDIFAVGGDAGVARLFRNNGDGTFTDKATEAGVAVSGEYQAGAVFVDFDGDGDLDLFVGGMLETAPRLFRNDGKNGGDETTFTDVFSTAFASYDLGISPNNYAGTLADYDLDGDLDFLFAHSSSPYGPKVVDDPSKSSQHLWRNNITGSGSPTFTDVSIEADVSVHFIKPPPGPVSIKADQTFSPNFADINEDGYPDILMVADIGESLVLVNNGDGGFLDFTDSSQYVAPTGGKVAGMGAAVGDYNNDGHFDWFMSQISTVNDGNRLYQGKGDGTFIDVVWETEPFPSVGMERGHWGWGACFADLDNDRHLDIFHVNGLYWPNNDFWPSGRYDGTPAAAFISNGDGTFTERGTELGLADTGEGRGISCFDYDRDGDIDIAISNHNGPFKLYQNTLISPPAEDTGFVTVTVTGDAPNTSGVGTRIVLRSSNPSDTGPAQLLRQIGVDGNYLSSNLIEAHFGIGDWDGPFELEATWPDGRVTVHTGIARNTFVNLTQPPFDRIFRGSFE
jgi:hypothetical protein